MFLAFLFPKRFDFLVRERERMLQSTHTIYLTHFSQAKHIFFLWLVVKYRCARERVWHLDSVFFPLWFVSCTTAVAAARLLSWISVKKTEKNAMWFFPCTWTDETEVKKFRELKRMYRATDSISFQPLCAICACNKTLYSQLSFCTDTFLCISKNAFRFFGTRVC